VRTHLEFRAERFGGANARPNTYNPEIRGEELADFLSAKFREGGLDPNVIEEDWGWMVELKADPFPLWLGCSNHGDDGDWLVFIEPSQPEIRKWLKKIDTREKVAAVTQRLEQILGDDGGATNLTWWSDEDSGRK
jgi:hypothetical protein